MMETIRIRQQGFGNRLYHKDFLERYRILAPGATSAQESVEILSKWLGVGENDWQMGYTKIFMRQFLSDKLERLVNVRRRVSARTIQEAWKLSRESIAAVRVQSAYRRHQCTKEFNYLKFQIISVQAFARSVVATRAYNADRANVTKAQSVVRGMLGRTAADKLRDPYRNMSVKDITTLLNDAKADLEAATAARDFAKCGPAAALVEKLEEAKASAVLKMEIVPRPELEVLVLEVQLKLDDAVASKDFAACKDLTAHMDALKERRKLCPTPEELVGEIAACHEEIDAAMAKKDYTKCESLQATLETLEGRKAQAEAEVTAPTSAADVQAKIDAVKAELDAAVAAKQFTKCEEHQVTLANLEAALAKVPTAESLVAEAEALKGELATVKEAKDYRRQAEITIRMQELDAGVLCVLGLGWVGVGVAVRVRARARARARVRARVKVRGGAHT